MMNTLRQSSRGLVAVAALWLAGGDAVADDRKYETPIGLIVLDVDSTWRDLQPVPGGVNGIAFESGSGARAMQFVLATLDESGKKFDVPAVRDLAEAARKAEVADGLDVSGLKSLAGSKLIAFYYEGTSRPGAKRGPGEFERMIAGFIYTDNFPLMFTIAWNEGGKAAADRAFDAVKRLRIVNR